MWRTVKCDKNMSKNAKNIYEVKSSGTVNNLNNNYSQQIIWRELNRTVCLAQVSVL